MKRLLSLLLLLSVCLCVKAQYENHWTQNPYQYPNNMTIIGVVSFNGVEQRSQSIELGAFCGEECRGSVMANYEEMFDRYFFYMMVYGEQNDEISFRCYDHKLNLELNLIQETFIDFQTNAMIGGVVEPFVFSFQTYQFDVSLDIFPEDAGDVIGEGIYNQYDTCYLELIPATSYQFDALLENGDTVTKQNHYSFIVLSDRHFEAYFSEKPVYYQITAEADPSSGGVVTGIGEYLEGESCTLQISANEGYIYEGLYENEQLVTSDTVFSVVADADHHYVAKFSVKINHCQITADIFPNEAGTITGLGIYQEGTTCSLLIVTNEGYDFVALKENDMVVSEEDVYSFIVDSDRHFVAEFSKLEYYYDVTAEVYPENAGVITGTGTYKEGDACTLNVTANVGYRFVAFKENDVVVSEETTYSFIVDSDRHLLAEFELQEYDVNLSASPEEGGTVSGTGSGTYTHGTTIYAIANPNENYIFLNWTDEDGTVLTTNQQYVFEVTQDVDYTANFVYVDDISENADTYLKIYPNPTSDFIIIENDVISQCDVTLYDIYGKIVLKERIDNNKLDVSNIPNGTYVLTIKTTKNNSRTTMHYKLCIRH